MSNDLVRVAVRIRPLVQSEIDKGCRKCLNVVPGLQQIQITSTEKAFTFNHVFSDSSSQEEFYNVAIKDMVTNIFEGYNVTILAYGQTGSGKTFSMGTNYVENDVNCGVIPRAVNDIFEYIKEKDEWDFKVSVSFMELYQEQLYDLLPKKARNQCMVDIREDIRGIKMVGLSDVLVKNTQETLQCLADGSLNRATGATAMNNQSSRSHAIFTISVQQQKKNDVNTAKFAKFHLVDLAGSERSKKTQATGERFKEGVNINKGLLALGNVISQLGEGGNVSYIGYRDSKLTRLLQDSLGGNSVTLMIACVSPADYNVDETTSTLRYADRAKKIKNKPIINQDPQVAEINNLKKIIQELRSSRNSQGNGGAYCPPEHLELIEKNISLHRKVRGLTEKLNANLTEIVHMHEIADLAEHSRDQLINSISKILEDCESLLKNFDDNPNDIEIHKAKLEDICLKILAMQKEKKKAIDELVTHELSVESSNDISVDSELMSNSNEENSIHNETDDLDEKHEEHTLLQAERVNEVQYINKQLAIKEKLIYNLRNDSQIKEYQKELEEMEHEIKRLQTQKEELDQQLRNVQSCAKLAETRRKKVQELEKKIAELSRKCLEQNKVIKNKEKSDTQIKNLTNEITTLKQTKVKLIRHVRTETDRFNKWKKSREQELSRLKNQDRKRLLQLTRLQAESDKQKNVLKRKLEEAQASHKRLKDALDLQKKASLRREKTSNVKESIHSWVTQELEVLRSTAEAECTLDKLRQDKAYYADQLAELQLNNESKNLKIAELMDFVESRNNQIKALEQHIKESNEENRARNRWHVISSMVDAKEALKIMADAIATNEKEHSKLKSKYSDTIIEKYELQESNSKLRANDREKDLQIEELQRQVASYKERSENLENQALTEKNTNIMPKVNKIKIIKPKVEVSDFDYSLLISDESILEDDVTNDPDWRKTPLFNRIQKLEHNNKNIVRESKAGLKRSSNGEIKCNCKTACSSRLCSCRKNSVSCESCNCNPLTCTNRNGNDSRRTLFIDVKEPIDSSMDIENKKVKLEDESF